MNEFSICVVSYPAVLQGESSRRLICILFVYLYIPMATRKKVLKVLIIIILAIFLLSTGLISVMYLGGNTTTGTGDISS
jgi:hypothetical protein